MNVRDIVRKAWQITQVHLKKLFWYGFTPSFFTVVVSSVYLTYQYNAFKHSSLFGTELAPGEYAGLAAKVWELASSHSGVSIFLIILSVLIFIGYMLTPPTFRGTLICALMRIKNYESIDGSFEVGVRRFFPMFEFGLLMGSFSVTTLFTESSFVARWWGLNILFLVLPFLLFVAAAGLVVSFLFTYTEFFIVLQNRGITKSIMESTILVIANLRKTFLVFVLMLLIGVRIILNVVLVLLIPMLLAIVMTYFATTYFSVIGIILVGLVALAVLIVSSYLFGLFHIFATAVWVLTFCELTEKKEVKPVAPAATAPSIPFPAPVAAK